jgi:hypothetical protein
MPSRREPTCTGGPSPGPQRRDGAPPPTTTVSPVR